MIRPMTASSPGSPDPEIVSSRTLDVPRERVFRAFAEPELLRRWWGPSGFTNTFERFDFRAGGSWHFTMYAPDGTAIPMVKRFLEVSAPERIVLLHEQGEHTFRMSMVFEEAGSGTTLTWRMVFQFPEEAERVRAFVEPANEQNFDRLEEVLREMDR